MVSNATRQVQAASAVPPLTQAQAERIARGELDAFVALLQGLGDDDWSRPTDCDLWSVRDVVAHQGGHVQAGMGLRGLFAQFSPRLTRPYRKQGMNALDATNQSQVDLRRDWPAEKLIAEVRDGTTRAIAARRSMALATKLVRVPAPGYGLIRVDYLLRVIFPRDMWIHRLDIAGATGRPFVMTPGHDGLLLAHALRDTERNVRKLLPGYAVRLELDGPAGGAWRLGHGSEVPVTMDVPTFMRLSSGRQPASRCPAEVAVDDPALRERVLASLVAVY